MAHLIDSHSVGFPGLVVMMLAFLLFFIALVAARGRSSGADAAPEKQRRSSTSIIGILVQMLGFVAVGIGPIRIALASGSPLAIGEGAAIAALMAFALGMFLAASRAMGRNWSLVARTRSDHDLVTWGPFAMVRHPIYVALFTYMLALALAFGHWRGLILGVPLFALGTWLRITQEEKLLRAQFGEAYDAYARRVKRFVPGVF